MFMAGCGCGCCDPVFTDDFNRADSSSLGSGWDELVSGAEIASNTLQTTGPCIIKTTATRPDITIDSVTYFGSSQVSIKWTPLDDAIPSVHRLHLGQRDEGIDPNLVRYGIFVQLQGGSSGPAPYVLFRLGYINNYTDIWLTDELPIGWDDGPQYTSGTTQSDSDKLFSVTLCWEPENLYATFRGAMKVKATIASYTGAFYTLEGTVNDDLPMNSVFIESTDNARWDDFSWSKTSPDFPECPYCGQCLFAADVTTADDQGTAAYSSSGGTFARNVTTGALELTSTTATWLVDLPARNSLSLNYSADWSGSSPTFDISIGAITLQISKTLTPEQVIAVTVNGSGASSMYTALTNSTLSICFVNDKIVVATSDTTHEYDSAVNEGYTNLAMTAGSSKVSVTEIQVSRSDSESIARLNCTPCDLETDVDCSVCPPEPFAPYGVIVATCDMEVVTEQRRGNVHSNFPENTDLGSTCPTSYVDLECVSTSWDSVVVLEASTVDTTAATKMRISSSDTALCAFSYTKDFCSNDASSSTSDQVSVTASLYALLFKTADATPQYYLAVDARLAERWPTTGSNGGFQWVVYKCVGGVITAIPVDAENIGDTGNSFLDGYWTETEVDWPYWHSDNFTECDKVDFDLSGIGGVIHNLFTTATYPTSMTIHVPR